jgi:hypothetical protein
MARGIIKLPLENGRKELAWYVGNANVQGASNVNFVVPLKVERDADFVCKRMWLVQWPASIAGTPDQDLALPAAATAILRDGGTSRGLALVPSSARMLFPDASKTRMVASWLGLPSPFLIRANNALFVEVNNPAAGATPWTGNIYLCAEGFKVYPYLPEEFPATIEQYAVPFDLDANASILSPAAAAANVQGQSIILTNNGEGKMLVKGMRLRLISGAGVDVTDTLLPFLGFNIIDSTSGSKKWVQNTNQDSGLPFIPASILTLNNTFLPWSSTRYIDPNGVIQLQVLFPQDAATIAYLAANFAWPVQFNVSFNGALLPR